MSLSSQQIIRPHFVKCDRLTKSLTSFNGETNGPYELSNDGNDLVITLKNAGLRSFNPTSTKVFINGRFCNTSVAGTTITAERGFSYIQNRIRPNTGLMLVDFHTDESDSAYLDEQQYDVGTVTRDGNLLRITSSTDVSSSFNQMGFVSVFGSFIPFGLFNGTTNASFDSFISYSSNEIIIDLSGIDVAGCRLGQKQSLGENLNTLQTDFDDIEAELLTNGITVLSCSSEMKARLFWSQEMGLDGTYTIYSNQQIYDTDDGSLYPVFPDMLMMDTDSYSVHDYQAFRSGNELLVKTHWPRMYKISPISGVHSMNRTVVSRLSNAVLRGGIFGAGRQMFLDLYIDKRSDV